MANQKQPSTALIISVAVVACVAIASVALILVTLEKSELPEGWLGMFLGFLGTTMVAVISLAKIDKIGQQVDDLANGKMDAKIRAGVADVLGDHLIDPAATQQLEADRARRDEGH